MPCLPRLATLAPLLCCALACAAPSQGEKPGARESIRASETASSAQWDYEIALDESLAHMRLSLCIRGPRPLRLLAGEEALTFVERAQVRDGPELAREGQSLVVETLGEHGCLDIDIDVDAAARSGGRDSMRSGDTLMLAPDRWLWYPGAVPEQVEARARFDLPEGVAATVPWTTRPDGWRALEHSAFGWNAWLAFGRYEPLRFELGTSEFEIAVLEGPRAATDEGIIEWLRGSAATSVELYGAFPRERVSFVVIPMPAWGDDPVLFGMARRGGGGSVMLLLDAQAEDADLPGEWVSAHELLHLGMPYVDAPWMSEGFVTYYTEVLRARQGVLTRGDAHAQAQRALVKLQSGFRRGNSGSRTLAYASDNMRREHSYSRVYWGGAAVAFDLDVSIRHASANRHSLDDLLLDMQALAPVHRRFPASELIAQMDARLAAWYATGELQDPLLASELIERHLASTSIPQNIELLGRLAVEGSGSKLRLAADPPAEAEVREAMFRPHGAPN